MRRFDFSDRGRDGCMLHGDRAVRRFGIILGWAAALLMLPLSAGAEPTYQLIATVQPSQFGPSTTRTFMGTTEPAPTQTVTESIGEAFATATANPFDLFAMTSTRHTGITGTQAFAIFGGMRIDFADNDALRDLIPSGKTGLDLLLHVDVEAIINVPNASAIFGQADGFVHWNVVASSSAGLFFEVRLGGVDVLTSPSDFSVLKSGFFDSASIYGNRWFGHRSGPDCRRPKRRWRRWTADSTRRFGLHLELLNRRVCLRCGPALSTRRLTLHYLE
jgi:hypothetical protein